MIIATLRRVVRLLSVHLVLGAGSIAAILIVAALGFGALRPVLADLLILLFVRGNGAYARTLLHGDLGMLLGLTGTLVGLSAVLGVVLPAYDLLGVLVRADEDGRSALETWRAHRRTILRADTAVLMAAYLGALAGLGSILVAHTAVMYAQYAGGRVLPPRPYASLYFLLAGGTAGFWLTFVAVRYAPVYAIEEDRPPLRALFDSASWVRRYPRRGIAQVVLQTLSLGLAMVILIAVSFSEPWATLVVVAGVGYIIVSVALIASVIAYTLLPDTPIMADRSLDSGRRWGRHLVVGALVITAATAGAGLVRTADTGVHDVDQRPLPQDPSAAVDVAVENTVLQDHRRTTTTVYRASPNETSVNNASLAVDFTDRQLYTSYAGRDAGYVGVYYGEGILANHDTVSRDQPIPASGWDYAFPAPAYGGGASGRWGHRLASAPWEPVNATGDRLVYRIDDPMAVARLLPAHRGLSASFSGESRATLVVDRERGVVKFVRVRQVSRDTGRTFSTTTHYKAIGTVDVRRSPSLGPRGPAELLWDVLYY